VRLLHRTVQVLREQGPVAVAVKAGWTIRNELRHASERRRAPALLRHLHADPPRTPQAVTDLLWSPAGALVRPDQVRSELEGLLRAVAGEGRPRRILEIGTHNGGTLLGWSAIAADDATIISLDLPLGAYGGGYREWRAPIYRGFARAGQSIHLLRADSHEPSSLRQVEAILRAEPLDFLFIDGDHSYSGVRQDYQMYAPLVRASGLIAFHDIAHHPPRAATQVDRFWREVKAGHDHTEYIRDPAQGWAGIGLMRAQ
jgi:predicted O-methyltransferase YrrM